ncbi:MAG: PfkB family carbohydrate kinase [Tissierellia bacterium]|nr:PfkB family carbohydrate kinase [Tissierellia bacterium]
MTPREQEIMELIRANPQISQQEIGNRLNIKRSSVAVHINHLMNKGYILGRGYLLKKEPYIVVIGGASVDLRGIPDETIMMEDSNPGTFHKTAGGVGRNIGENLARLGYRTDMITLLADDRFGNWLMEKGMEVNLTFHHSFILQGEQTPTYLEILDEKGEMVVAISDMKLLDKFTPERMEKKKEYIENAEIIVVDTNLPKETLEYLFDHLKGTFLVDGVSAAKVKKLKGFLPKIHTLKCNKHEAESLLSRTLEGKEALKEGAKELVAMGLHQVVITCGKDGALSYNGKEGYLLQAPSVKVKNATGAGDAFTAGLAYGMVKGWEFLESLRFAMGSSIVALGDEGTNAIGLNPEEVKRNLGGIIDVKY